VGTDELRDRGNLGPVNHIFANSARQIVVEVEAVVGLGSSGAMVCGSIGRAPGGVSAFSIGRRIGSLLLMGKKVWFAEGIKTLLECFNSYFKVSWYTIVVLFH
jgi:hypothetical protein